jgi:hypothetical protein
MVFLLVATKPWKLFDVLAEHLGRVWRYIMNRRSRSDTKITRRLKLVAPFVALALGLPV